MKVLVMARFILGLLVLHCAIGVASPQSAAWFGRDAGQQVMIPVDLFLSSECPHCHKADVFFQKLEKKDPWIVVHRHIINQDKAALQLFYERLKQQHSDNFSVPALFFCDSRWVGFADEITTGKALVRGLAYCQQRISQQGTLTDDTVRVLRQWGGASQFEVSNQPTAALFVAVAAITDALNPCTLFCLDALLAFLWLYPTNRWRQCGIGMVFVGSLLVLHYIQQVYASLYYQTIAPLSVLGMLLGIVLLFFVGLYYRNRPSFSGVIRPWVWLLIALIPWVIRMSQQACPFNVALVFEQWFSSQTFSPWRHALYRMEYQIIYVLPSALLLLAFFLLGRKPRVVARHRLLSLAGCVMLVCIGVGLVIYPRVFTMMWVSEIVFLVSLVAGWLMVRRELRQSR